MKTIKKTFFEGMIVLCTAFLLVGCSSDKKLRESLNEYVNDMTQKYFPTGKFVFDENVIEPNCGKITIDMLKQLQEEGIITLEVLQNEGSKYAVNLSITDAGMKYAKQANENIYMIELYSGKVDEILEKNFDEPTGTGVCYFSVVYDKVTPFGKILNGINSGDIYEKKRHEKVKKVDGTWQAEYPFWKKEKK